MSEAKAPDIIEMRRPMNSETKRQRMEASIRLAQEWKASGLTKGQFAQVKGIDISKLKYQIRKVQENAPEALTESALAGVEFAPIPMEHVYTSGRPEMGASMSNNDLDIWHLRFYPQVQTVIDSIWVITPAW